MIRIKSLNKWQAASWCQIHVGDGKWYENSSAGGPGWTVGTVGGNWMVKFENPHDETLFLLSCAHLIS